MTLNQQAVIQATNAWIGTPYRHQASRINVGCDCLGLVRGVWRELYGCDAAPVPPYAQFGRDHVGASQLLDAAQQFLQFKDQQLKAGYVVLFQLHKKLPPRHCGIMLSDTHFVHAQERLGVIKVCLDHNWITRIHSTYSFPQKDKS